jgi:hypothetical protein
MTSGVNVARPAMLDCPMHTYKSKEDGTFSFTFPAKANKDCRRRKDSK